MHMVYWMVFLAASVLTAAAYAADTGSDSQAPKRTSDTGSDARLDPEKLIDTLGTGAIGLRPPAASRSSDTIELPYGVNYSRENRTLLVPMDTRNEWGVGLNLNVNATPTVELAPPTSPLGLQPKKAPGLTFQKKF
jgi:hypothetical protein